MTPREAYDWRVGRWSRVVGRKFIRWLDPPAGLRWLDIGCGAGALSQSICEMSAPAFLAGIDPEQDDVALARKAVHRDHAKFLHAEFQQAAAEAIPFADRAFDFVVSGLVFHFLRDPELAFREMRRVCTPEGCIGGYVWDFAGEMQIVRRFWDAAIAVDRNAADADPAPRTRYCEPKSLAALFADAGMIDVEVQAIDAIAQFPSFATYWRAISDRDWSGGPYINALSKDVREEIRKWVLASLSLEADGGFALTARAWAVRGRNRGR